MSSGQFPQSNNQHPDGQVNGQHQPQPQYGPPQPQYGPPQQNHFPPPAPQHQGYPQGGYNGHPQNNGVPAQKEDKWAFWVPVILLITAQMNFMRLAAFSDPSENVGQIIIWFLITFAAIFKLLWPVAKKSKNRT